MYMSSLFLQTEEVYLELCFVNVMFIIADLFENLVPFLIVGFTSIKAKQLHVVFEFIDVYKLVFSLFSSKFDHVFEHCRQTFRSIQITLSLNYYLEIPISFPIVR